MSSDVIDTGTRRVRTKAYFAELSTALPHYVIALKILNISLVVDFYNYRRYSTLFENLNLG